MTEELWSKFASQNVIKDGDAFLYSTELNDNEVLRKLAENDFNGYICILNPKIGEIDRQCVFTDSQPVENTGRWTLLKSWTNITSTEEMTVYTPPVEPTLVDSDADSDGLGV